MVETCCCGCCTVAKGTAIIAILDIIGGIFQIIRSSFTVTDMISRPDTISEDLYPGFQNYPAGYITSQFIGILMALVYAILSGCLFQGYRTKNARLCTPWLYWNYISLGLAVFYMIAIFVVLFMHGLVMVGVVFAIIYAIMIAIAVYFVRVVQRFVNELRGEVYGAVNRNIN